MASVICTFLHRYRWGYQIRGDERGFLEKAVHYKNRGLNLVTLEKKPSFQKSCGIDAYTSFEMGDFRLPIRNPLDLASLIFRSSTAVRRLGKFKPLAVYAYNQDPENVVTGLLLKVLLGRPLVVVYHHITKLSFAPFGVGIAERRRMGYGLLSSMWLSLVPALNRLSVGKADVHLALSFSTKREVEAWAGVKVSLVVGNGVDAEKFRPIAVEKVYDAVFLGRMVPQKGIGTLLRAWSIVARRKPGSKLALIGGADPEQIQLYRKLAEEEGVLDLVEFKGFLSDAEVIRTLSSSKMFVFPSSKEGFAQAISQAMACGLCCVISDIPSLRETYGEVAHLVPPGNPLALADQIGSMLENEEDLQSCGAVSRQYVERFSWGEVVDKELWAMRRIATLHPGCGKM